MSIKIVTQQAYACPHCNKTYSTEKFALACFTKCESKATKVKFDKYLQAAARSMIAHFAKLKPARKDITATFNVKLLELFPGTLTRLEVRNRSTHMWHTTGELYVAFSVTGKDVGKKWEISTQGEYIEGTGVVLTDRFSLKFA